MPNRAAGYRAPEVTDTRKVSQKGDVDSFGVLLLELLTRKAPAQAFANEEGVDLPRWVQSVVKEEWTSEVFDEELLRYQNAEEEMVQLLQLAIDCSAQIPDNRPSMSEVVVRIEEINKSRLASAVVSRMIFKRGGGGRWEAGARPLCYGAGVEGGGGDRESRGRVETGLFAGLIAVVGSCPRGSYPLKFTKVQGGTCT